MPFQLRFFRSYFSKKNAFVQSQLPLKRMNSMEALLTLIEKRKTLQRGELLKKEGSLDTHVYYIEEGSLKIYFMDGIHEQIIRFGYRTNLVVALDSFLEDKPSPLIIEAMKKVTIGIIPKQRIMEFFEEGKEQQQLWINILQSLVMQQLDREMDILTTSPEERYRRVLQRSPQLFQEVPNRYIANYLRMSAETLSRLKKS